VFAGGGHQTRRRKGSQARIDVEVPPKPGATQGRALIELSEALWTLIGVRSYSEASDRDLVSMAAKVPRRLASSSSAIREPCTPTAPGGRAISIWQRI
jgi:hypothetical protein